MLTHNPSWPRVRTRPSAASTQSLGLLTSLRFGGGLLLVPRFAVHSGEDWNYYTRGEDVDGIVGLLLGGRVLRFSPAARENRTIIVHAHLFTYMGEAPGVPTYHL
ncbi:hypothetical protein CSPAE12_01281 [Colletotrichum incanum]|nr:hypothetical protein CSPAE12_01281 [Colletotrichum incanum]